MTEPLTPVTKVKEEADKADGGRRQETDGRGHIKVLRIL